MCSCDNGFEWNQQDLSCNKKKSNLGLILGLALGIPFGLLILGLSAWGIYTCCAKPAVTTPTAPMALPGVGSTPAFPNFGVPKPEGPMGSISTLPPAPSAYSNRYIDPIIANNAVALTTQQTGTTTTTAMFPTGPSKIIEQQVIAAPGI